MDVSQLGEFGLIERLRNALKGGGPAPAVGIGDDAAVLDIPPGMQALATCDAHVEGVHFSRDYMTPAQIGRKAAAINISDIAAMGGQPTFMLVSLGLPPHTPVDFVDGLYQGLGRECSAHNVAIIGGNMAQSPERIFIDIMLLGQVEQGRALLRSQAQEGDLVAVTGFVGDSSAGLDALLHPGLPVDKALLEMAIQAHIAPSPRVEQGRVLSGSGLVHAALDISDGTVQDLGHVCEESRLGAEIRADKVPVSTAVLEVARARGKNPLEYALFGGEDYELLFTFPEKNRQALEKVLADSGPPMTVIGRMTAGKPRVAVLDPRSQPMDFTASGWNHFKV